ncbi:MAG TPA: sialidase family protein, partial [Candidatus Acidoferrales bacterium]|nr:sialidase family protein [Candidatus Acidoferrales bacterium]
MFWCLLALLALHVPAVSPTAPNKQPQLAAGGGTVALVFGSGESIWFARSADDGRTFDPPAKIGGLPKLLLGRHRGPRVAISGNTVLVSAISSSAGDLMMWRSADGGRTWSPPRAVNDQPSAAREGLHAMAADAAGHVAVVWLDDRTGHGKRLYGAFSDDAGASWGRNAMLYESPSGSICECCHPSLAALGSGEFVVMWRNSLNGYRDLYAMRLAGGGPSGPAEKQGGATWKLEACPMDGGGLAVRNGRVGSAWRRDKDVYLVEPGRPERKLAAGQDIALAANNQGWYAVWSSPAGIQAMLPGATEVTHVAPAGAFPAIVTTPGGVVMAAWEENGAIATIRF